MGDPEKMYDELDDAPTQVAGARVGPYRLGKPIGSGGMADVYQAVNVMTGERAAVKQLHSRMSGQSEVVARFIREGRALQRMNHPNIVRVMDHGITDEGDAWIAMELLDGASLADLIRQGPLGEARALRLMIGVAKALATVHAREMVHRDIKPENVFVVRPGTPEETSKLIDFGVAHVSAADLGENSVQYTSVGSLLGSAAFMAPEQFDGSGRKATAAADVFAFAVTLYEALTGRLPFDGDTVPAQIRARTSGTFVPLKKALGGARVSPALEDFMKRALAYDVAKRPQNGLELIHELNALLAAAQDRSTLKLTAPDTAASGLRAGGASLPAIFPEGSAPVVPPQPDEMRVRLIAVAVGIGVAAATLGTLWALHAARVL